MKIILYLLLWFYSASLLALPAQIEFWFFSPNTRAELFKFISSPFQFSSLMAENSFGCIPMGEGCFDPQQGYVEGIAPALGERIEIREGTMPPTLIKGALDTSLIECDPKNGFDLFCGEAREVKTVSSELEIWFDISTSMRSIFPEGKNCLQLQFVTAIRKQCQNGLTVRVFNSRLRPAASDQEVCYYQGLNNGRELIAQLQAASAKKIIVISDSDEFAGELRTFIEEGNYATRGMGAPIYSSSILSFAGEDLCH